ASSSTMSTALRLIRSRPSRAAPSSGLCPFHRDSEVPAFGAMHGFDTRAVAFAELARDVKPETRALRLGGEERLEQVHAGFRPHPDTVVGNVELQGARLLRRRDADLHRARFLAAMAPGIAHEVPEHLVEMLPVEPHALRGAHVEADGLAVDLLGRAEFMG